MDTFELYDLAIEVVGNPSTYVCAHVPGEAFTARGEDLTFTNKNHSFSLYALSAILPLLPAMQRPTDHDDWMSSDDLVACPDPNCGAQFKIKRLGKSTFNRSDTTATMNPNKSEEEK